MMVLIGLDLGTTVVKAAAFTEYGMQKGLEASSTPSTISEDGSTTIHPDDLVATAWNCVSRLIRSLDEATIAAICITPAMFSIFPVDSDGNPLERSRTWADSSTKPVPPGQGHPDFYNLTGCRIYPAYPRERIRTAAVYNPEVVAKAARWVSLAEYLFYKWTGNWVISRSIASSTGLLDIHSLKWSQEALEWSGITEEQLSRLTNETDSLPAINGPVKDAPIVLGATDGPICHIGTDSMGPGDMTSTVGTSAALRMISQEPVLDSQARTWCYYLTDNIWTYGGASNGGAIAVRWLANYVIGQTDYTQTKLQDLIDGALKTVPPGCEGLTFLPFLTGERFPDWDQSLRGIMSGLSLSHGRLHLVRAAIEGTIYRLRAMYDTMCSMGHCPDRIRVTGGYTKSPKWLQMQADVFNHPLEIPDVEQASAFGAACLAAEASEVTSAADMAKTVRIKEVLAPDPTLYDTYQEACERSEKLYRMCREMYKLQED